MGKKKSIKKKKKEIYFHLMLSPGNFPEPKLTSEPPFCPNKQQNRKLISNTDKNGFIICGKTLPSINQSQIPIYM